MFDIRKDFSSYITYNIRAKAKLTSIIMLHSLVPTWHPLIFIKITLRSIICRKKIIPAFETLHLFSNVAPNQILMLLLFKEPWLEKKPKTLKALFTL